MRVFLIALAVILGALFMTGASAPAQESGRPVTWRATTPNPEPPFERSHRAQSVWNSGVCWSDCGSHCAWGVAGCLRDERQGVCLAKGDTCDLYCQRQCRNSGGPLVEIFD